MFLNDDFFDNLFVRGSFGRPFLESEKCKVYSKEKYDLLVFNTLGVDSKDLKVEVKNSYLSVQGITKVEEIDAENKVDYCVGINTARISNIDYKEKNGYLYVYLYRKDTKAVKIKEIKE